jgi:PhnB protein
MSTSEKFVGAGVAVRPIPEGYHSVTPYLTVPGIAGLIEFLKKAFDATEKGRFEGPGGSIMHAEVRIGDSIVMMGEPNGEIKPMPAMLHLYVPDVDETYQRALQAGAKSLREPANQFYGDRSAGVVDASGNQWWISTHVEDVSDEEMRRRMDAAGH